MTDLQANRQLRRFYGKYRGHVVDNNDPQQLGRILAKVPAVDGMATNWALPCTPYAGPGVGMLYLPPIDALVWVEFEGGDPDQPIWVGGFWGRAEDVPIAYQRNAGDPAQVKVIKTTCTTIIVDDTADTGEVTIDIEQPAVSQYPVKFTMFSEGAKLETGVCTMTMVPEDGVTTTVSETTLTQTPTSIEAVSELISQTTKPTQIESTGDGITISAPMIEATVEGEVTLEAAETEITSIVTVTGAVEITGATEITGAVEIEGATEIVGAFVVSGATSLNGGVAILGGGTIDGGPIL